MVGETNLSSIACPEKKVSLTFLPSFSVLSPKPEKPGYFTAIVKPRFDAVEFDIGSAEIYWPDGMSRNHPARRAWYTLSMKNILPKQQEYIYIGGEYFSNHRFRIYIHWFSQKDEKLYHLQVKAKTIFISDEGDDSSDED